MRWLLGAFLGLAAAPLWAEDVYIATARYTDPTTRYDHAILGDGIEHAGLEATLSDGRVTKIIWRETIVFEDTEPRLVDMDNDGSPEIMGVETHEDQGARVGFWALNDGQLVPAGRIPFIGTRYRWLAPIGAADMDGDGFVEFAYIDRPHLVKTLRVWRYMPIDNGVELVEIASAQGLTNHRIGERDIAGGLRDCGAGVEMITATADWSQVVSTRLVDGRLVSTPLGAHEGRASFTPHLSC